jgi:hypothetical protein
MSRATRMIRRGEKGEERLVCVLGSIEYRLILCSREYRV